MTKKNDIRDDYYRKGKTVSEIARDTGHDRKTVRGIVMQDDWNLPPADTAAKPLCPKLGPFKPLIDEWLTADRLSKPKQRHTSRRVYNRLRTEDGTKGIFNCSYETVNIYVKAKKKDLYGDRAEGYIPLNHAPGEAQADFGTAEYIERGARIEGKAFNMSFPYSNQGYQQLFPGENAECLFEGLANVFGHIGGVPHEIWFDNMSAAVIDIRSGADRLLTDRFLRFSAHYGFSPVFCNKGQGHEKGSIENKVGYQRRNMLVPVPAFAVLDEYNRGLLSLCDKDGDREHYRHVELIRSLFREDKKRLLPLPKDAFETAGHRTAKTNKYAIVTLDKLYEYSTAPALALTRVKIRLTSQYVTICDENGREVVTHERLYGDKPARRMNWLPYLDQLSRRPRAVKYSGVYDMMPDEVKRYIDGNSGGDVGSIVGMLAEITRRTGWESAVATVAEAVSRQANDPDSLMALHRRLHMNVPELPPIALPLGIPGLVAYSPDLAAYDVPAMKGGIRDARG